MLLDFYSSDCYLSKLGRESHRFSFVTFCTVNGPEFGRLFSACQQAQRGLCSQGPLPCGGQTGRRAFQKINRHLVQIRALLSLLSFLSWGPRQLPGPPYPPGTGPIICPLRRVGSLVAPGRGGGPPDWTGCLGLTLRGFPAQISGTGARHRRSLVVFTVLVWGLQGQGMQMMCLWEGAVRRGWAWPSCLSPAHGVQGLWGVKSRYLLLVPRPPPPPRPLCLLTQSVGEREASRWLPPPPPPPAMEPHVNKAQGSDNLQSWPHSCSWLASLPIPGLAPSWAPPSPPAQLPAGTVCQYSSWSVRELRPSNRIWARLLQSSETEGGTTAEHPCSSGGGESGKASWRRLRWCPGGG